MTIDFLITLKLKEMKTSSIKKKKIDNKIIVQDDIRLLRELSKTNNRHLNLKLLLNNYYTTKK